MKAAAVVLLCVLVLCPCLFAQKQPSQVIVANTETAPVPVTFSTPAGDMVTIVEDDVPAIPVDSEYDGTVFVIPVTGYRALDFFGHCDLGGVNNSQYNIQINSLDSNPTGVAWALRNRRQVSEPILQCDNPESPSVTGGISQAYSNSFALPGPYLEIRIRPGLTANASKMTLKAYLQK